MKHAFRDMDEGTVCLEIAGHDEYFTLVVADNGLGYDITSDDSRKSLGSNLIMTLVRQVHGSFDVNTESGTCYTFNIPFDSG